MHLLVTKADIWYQILPVELVKLDMVSIVAK